MSQFLELNSIPHKKFVANLNSKDSCISFSCVSSLFSDILNSIGNEEEKNNNDTLKDQLRKKTEKKSRLLFSRKDGESSIQLSNIALKRSCHER